MPKINLSKKNFLTKKTIFITAGGTGGHLFPAIAVAKSFEKSQSHFLVDKRTEKILLDKDFNIFEKYLYNFSSISSKVLGKDIISLKGGGSAGGAGGILSVFFAKR